MTMYMLLWACEVSYPAPHMRSYYHDVNPYTSYKDKIKLCVI
jgi:hypothetical protein